jgi:hypothetical protein
MFVCWCTIIAIETQAQPALQTEITISKWQVSQPFPAAQIDLKMMPYPRFYTIFSAGWRDVQAQPSGLVDLSRIAAQAEGQPTCVLVRTIFQSKMRGTLGISFGFSDEIAIYANGSKQYYGDRKSSPEISLADLTTDEMVYVTVEKGLNEIFFIVKETNDSWGFIAKSSAELVTPAKAENRLTKVWETSQEFLTPESVIYNSGRKVLYVSNFDNSYRPDASGPDEYTGFISRVNLDGEIVELKWIPQLHAPCGLGIFEEKLYTVERGFLTEIDIEKGRILNRYPIPGSDFLNDLTIDTEGNIYISDTSPTYRPGSRIYRFSDGRVKVWAEGEHINWANGLFFHDNRLLLGNSGDGCLKSIDIATKRIEKVTCLGAGVVDGIKVTAGGEYLVSHWEGQLYLVSGDAEVTTLFDTIGMYNCADFEFVADKNLLIIPTFVDNRVMAYRFE